MYEEALFVEGGLTAATDSEKEALVQFSTGNILQSVFCGVGSSTVAELGIWLEDSEA